MGRPSAGAPFGLANEDEGSVNFGQKSGQSAAQS